MRKRVLLGMYDQQKLISVCAPAQSIRSRCKYAPILCAYILTTHVLSVRPIIARCNELCAPFNRFQLFNKDDRVVLNIFVCSGTVNYNAGGTGNDQGFPRSLVAVVRRGGGGSGSQRLNVSWTKHMKFSLFAVSFFPITKKRKRLQSIAGLTDRHFQSPAERSRTRTRNLMYSNRASVITLDCMSEINCKRWNKQCFWHLTF